MQLVIFEKICSKYSIDCFMINYLFRNDKINFNLLRQNFIEFKLSEISQKAIIFFSYYILIHTIIFVS